MIFKLVIVFTFMAMPNVQWRVEASTVSADQCNYLKALTLQRLQEESEADIIDARCTHEPLTSYGKER
jgi:hypothetical protein